MFCCQNSMALGPNQNWIVILDNLVFTQPSILEMICKISTIGF